MLDSARRTLGPYRLIRRVGRGGFAEVWLAERDDADGEVRQVALKMVDVAEGSGEGARPDALLREARLVSWLKDPCIVAVEAADIEGDTVWMAMEYCDGGSVTSLLKRLRQRGLPMPPSVALRIGRDVARALAAAHSAKDPQGEPLCVVHRDLKPGNVLLTKAGKIKVCDFGIAKATDETNVTGTGLLKGTASYVAPELWHDVRAFSPASDAFALGTLLVELLTLERLHAGGAMPMVYRRIVEGTGREDAAKVQRTCPPVVPLVEALLARDPAARRRDLAGVADELDAALKALPGPANPGLLLRLLDCADGTATSPTGLPLRVGHAWKVLVKRILDVDLLLMPGPAGSEQAWELAMHPATEEPADDDEPPIGGFGPPELRTSGAALPAVADPDVPGSESSLLAVAAEPPATDGGDPGEAGATALWSGPVGGELIAAARARVAAADKEQAARTASGSFKRGGEPPASRDDDEAYDDEYDDDDPPPPGGSQTVSYTDLVPASEGRMPAAADLAPAAADRSGSRRAPAAPKASPTLPWPLIGAALGLWLILVVLVVLIAS